MDRSSGSIGEAEEAGHQHWVPGSSAEGEAGKQDEAFPAFGKGVWSENQCRFHV